MLLAHVATAATLRADLTNAEMRAEGLQEQIMVAQREIAEVTSSGSAVLQALEAAMVPLMAELALTRQACKEYCAEQGEAFITGPTESASPLPAEKKQSAAQIIADSEAEITHLQLDIAHFQHQSERLQIEERQRQHEISRLCGELSEAYEHLTYEQHCVRHHELCRQVGIDNSGGGWPGMGPCGVGRRTMEVRAEQRLRECAEQRGGRLARDVTKLSSDTSQQQASIAQLGARLMRAKKAHAERDRRLLHNHKLAKVLQAKLKVASGNGQPSQGQRQNELVDARADDLGATSDSDGTGRSLRSRKKGIAASTGKLPSLSF